MRQGSLFDELDPAEAQAASTDGEPTSDAADTSAATAPAARLDTAAPEAGDADTANPEADEPEADEPSRAGQATVRYAASDFWERYQQLRDATDGSADGSQEQPPTRITLRRLADQ